MQITDYSGESSVGIATLHLYMDKLTPLRQIDLKIIEGQQYLVVTGPKATFVSNSFRWGRLDEWTKSLSQATTILGCPLSLEVLQQIPSDEERTIQVSHQSGSKGLGRL